MEGNLLFNDVIPFIENQLGKTDWITVSANKEVTEGVDEGGYFCALIPNNKIDQVLERYDWDISKGDGLPGFITHFDDGKEITDYYRFSSDDGIEPIVYYRSFYGIKHSYLEISEEFRLFFNLFEQYNDLNHRKYIMIDDNGDEQEVAIIEDDQVTIKLKCLKEYLSARKMSLAIYFEFMRFSKKTVEENKLEKKEDDIKKEDLHYNILIRNISIDDKKTQSWLLGKKIIYGLKDYNPSPFGNSNNKFAEFIIGTDDDGGDILYTCDEDKLSNYFGKNKGKPQYLTPIVFKREVLNKYYDNPDKYQVQDGIIFCKGLWSLRVDNNNSKYVIAFLGDLGKLTYKEQLYWKSFNISGGGKISHVAWERDFEGKFTDPEQPDLFFKMKYEKFNKSWLNQYGWYLFKPLSDGDKHHFLSLHIPLSNNQKEFDEQVLSLTKIIIDSLNEKELAKGLTIEKENPKGIDKFEAFLNSKDLYLSDMIKFMRNLQSLRSTSVAHRKSAGSREYKEVQKYFDFEHKSFIEVFEDILMKTIWIFNTLEKHLLNLS